MTGIPVSGMAKTGDELVLLPQGEKGRIKAIRSTIRPLTASCPASVPP